MIWVILVEFNEIVLLGLMMDYVVFAVLVGFRCCYFLAAGLGVCFGLHCCVWVFYCGYDLWLVVYG